MEDFIVVPGEPALFQCRVTGNPTPEVSWFKNGAKIEPSDHYSIELSDAGLTSLTIHDVTEQDEAEYTCTAMNSAGSAFCTADIFFSEESRGEKLKTKLEQKRISQREMIVEFPPESEAPAEEKDETADSKPPKFVGDIIDEIVRVEVGGTARFTRRAEGRPKPQLIWYKDDVEIEPGGRFTIEYSNDGSSSLVIPNVRPEDEEEYICRAVNEAGQAMCYADLIVDRVTQQTEEPASPIFEMPVADEKVVAQEILMAETADLITEKETKVDGVGDEVSFEEKVVEVAPEEPKALEEPQVKIQEDVLSGILVKEKKSEEGEESPSSHARVHFAPGELQHQLEKEQLHVGLLEGVLRRSSIVSDSGYEGDGEEPKSPPFDAVVPLQIEEARTQEEEVHVVGSGETKEVKVGLRIGEPGKRIRIHVEPKQEGETPESFEIHREENILKIHREGRETQVMKIDGKLTAEDVITQLQAAGAPHEVASAVGQSIVRAFTSTELRTRPGVLRFFTEEGDEERLDSEVQIIPDEHPEILPTAKAKKEKPLQEPPSIVKVNRLTRIVTIIRQNGESEQVKLDSDVSMEGVIKTFLAIGERREVAAGIAQVVVRVLSPDYGADRPEEISIRLHAQPAGRPTKTDEQRVQPTRAEEQRVGPVRLETDAEHLQETVTEQTASITLNRKARTITVFRQSRAPKIINVNAELSTETIQRALEAAGERPEVALSIAQVAAKTLMADTSTEEITIRLKPQVVSEGGVVSDSTIRRPSPTEEAALTIRVNRPTGMVMIFHNGQERILQVQGDFTPENVENALRAVGERRDLTEAVLETYARAVATGAAETEITFHLKHKPAQTEVQREFIQPTPAVEATVKVNRETKLVIITRNGQEQRITVQGELTAENIRKALLAAGERAEVASAVSQTFSKIVSSQTKATEIVFNIKPRAQQTAGASLKPLRLELAPSPAETVSELTAVITVNRQTNVMTLVKNGTEKTFPIQGELSSEVIRTILIAAGERDEVAAAIAQTYDKAVAKDPSAKKVKFNLKLKVRGAERRQREPLRLRLQVSPMEITQQQETTIKVNRRVNTLIVLRGGQEHWVKIGENVNAENIIERLLAFGERPEIAEAVAQTFTQAVARDPNTSEVTFHLKPTPVRLVSSITQEEAQKLEREEVDENVQLLTVRVNRQTKKITILRPGQKSKSFKIFLVEPETVGARLSAEGEPDEICSAVSDAIAQVLEADPEMKTSPEITIHLKSTAQPRRKEKKVRFHPVVLEETFIPGETTISVHKASRTVTMHVEKLPPVARQMEVPLSAETVKGILQEFKVEDGLASIITHCVEQTLLVDGGLPEVNVLLQPFGARNVQLMVTYEGDIPAGSEFLQRFYHEEEVPKTKKRRVHFKPVMVEHTTILRETKIRISKVEKTVTVYVDELPTKEKRLEIPLSSDVVFAILKEFDIDDMISAMITQVAEQVLFIEEGLPEVSVLLQPVSAGGARMTVTFEGALREGAQFLQSMFATRESTTVEQETRRRVESEVEMIPPYFTVKPKPLTVDEGQSAEFLCEVVASPEPQIKWYHGNRQVKPGGRLTVTTTNGNENLYVITLCIQQSAAKDSGKYVLEVRNEAGEAKAMISLQVQKPVVEEKLDYKVPLKTVKQKAEQEPVAKAKQQPAAFIKVPKNCTVVEGENGMFDCKVSGEPRPSLKWYKDDQELKGERYVVDYNPSGVCVLYIQDATTSDSGWYSVTVSNELGEQTMRSKLTVELKPVEEESTPEVPREMEQRVVRKIKFQPIMLERFIIKRKITIYISKLQKKVSVHFEGSPVKEKHLKMLELTQKTLMSIFKEFKLEVYLISVIMQIAEQILFIENGLPEITIILKPFRTQTQLQMTFEGAISEETHRGILKIQLRLPSMEVAEEAVEETLAVAPEEVSNEAVVEKPEPVEPSEPVEQESAVVQPIELADVTSETIESLPEKPVDLDEVSSEGPEPEDVAPFFIEKPKAMSVEEGQDVEFVCKVMASPTPQITWYQGNRVLKSSGRLKITIESSGQVHTTTLVIKKVAPKDSGNLLLVIANDYGEARAMISLQLVTVKKEEIVDFRKQLKTAKQEKVKQVVKQEKPKEEVKEEKAEEQIVQDEQPKQEVIEEMLEVKPGEKGDPASFMKVPKNYNAPEGENAMFDCKIVGDPRPSVKWFKDDQDLEGERYTVDYNPSGVCVLYIRDTVPSDAGWYTCTVSNPCGTQSMHAKLTLDLKPVEVEPKTGKLELPFISKETVREVREGLSEAAIFEKIPEDLFIEEPQPLGSAEQVRQSSASVEPIELADVSTETIESLPEEQVDLDEVLSQGPEPEDVAPFFFEKPKAMSVEEGQDVEFVCKVMASPTPQITWYQGNRVLKSGGRLTITTETSGQLYITSLIIKKVAPKDSGNLLLVISNELGEARAMMTLQLVTVTKEEKVDFRKQLKTAKQEKLVKQESTKEEIEEEKAEVKPDEKAEPVAFVKVPKNYEIPEGETGMFDCKVVGEPRPSVKWFKDDQELEGERYTVDYNASGVCVLYVRDTVPTDAGWYTCTVSNPHGDQFMRAKLNLILKPVEVEPKTLQVEPIPSDNIVTEIVEGMSEAEILEEIPEDLVVEEPEEFESAERVKLKAAMVKAMEWADVSSEMMEALPEEPVDLDEVSSQGPEPEDVAPFFIEKPKAMSVEEGQDVEFVCKVMASPTPQITWYQGNRVLKTSGRLKIATETSGQLYTTCLMIKKIAPKDSGNLLLVVSNEFGEARAMLSLEVVTVQEEKVDFRKQLKAVKQETTKQIVKQEKLTEDVKEEKVEVKSTEKAEPASFVKVPKNCEAPEGETAMFDCKIVGDPRPSLKWSKNDQDLEGERYTVDYNPSGVCVLYVRDTVPTDAGWYTCTVSNPHGEQSMRAKLTLDLKPEEPTMIQANGFYSPDEEIETVEGISESEIIEEIPEELIVEEPEEYVGAELVKQKCASLEPMRETDVTSEIMEALPEEQVDLEEVSSQGAEPEDVAPFFIEKPKAISVEEGQDVEFVCKVMASPAPQITWYQGNRVLKSGGRLKITTETSGQLYTTYLKIKKVAPKDSGNLLLTVSNDYGEARAMMSLEFKTVEKKEKVEFKKKLKTVKQEKPKEIEPVKKTEPAAFVKVPKNCSTVEGETAVFDCKVVGGPRPSLKWFKEDQELEGERYTVDYNPSGVCVLYIRDTVPTDAGWYACTVSNPHGEQAMRAKLAVEPILKEPEPKEEAAKLKDEQELITITERREITFATLMLEYITILRRTRIFVSRISRRLVVYFEELEPREKQLEVELSSDLVLSILREFDIESMLASLITQVVEQVLFIDGGLPEITILLQPVGNQTELQLTFDGEMREEYRVLQQPIQLQIQLQSEEEVREVVEEPLEAAVPEEILEEVAAEEPEPLEEPELVEQESASVEQTEFADVTSETIESLPEEPVDLEDVSSEGEPEPEDVAPFFFEKPKAMSVEEGQDVEFVCKVMASPTPQITWYQGNRVLKTSGRLKITTETSGQLYITCLKIKKVAPKDSGNLLLVISNNLGEARAMISLELVTVKKEKTVDFRKQLKTVKQEKISPYESRETSGQVTPEEKAEPAAFVKVPKNCEAPEGETAMFDCKVLGEPRPTLKWFKDDQELEGERYTVDYNPSGVCVLYIRDTVPSDAGWYTCTVSNDHGEQSMRAKLVLHLKPVEPETIEPKLYYSPDEDIELVEAIPESEILEEIPEELIVEEPEEYVGAELVKEKRALLEPMKETDVTTEIMEALPEEQADLDEVSSQGPEPEDVAPFFIEKPKAMSVEEGQDVEFVCKVLASPAPQITWYQGNRVLKTSGRLKITTDTSGQLYTTSLIIKKVAPKDVRNLMLTVSNDCGEVRAMISFEFSSVKKEERVEFKKQLKKIVKQEKPKEVEPVEKTESAAFIKVPKNCNTLEGETAMFDCKVVGEPRPSLKWSKDDQDLEGERYTVDYNPSGVCVLYIRDTVPSDAGWYTCTVSNPHGEQSMRAKLAVEPKPVPIEPEPELEEPALGEDKDLLTIVERREITFATLLLEYITILKRTRIFISRISRRLVVYVEDLEPKEKQLEVELSSDLVISILKEFDIQTILASLITQVVEQVLFVDGGLPEITILLQPVGNQTELQITFDGEIPEGSRFLEQKIQLELSMPAEEEVEEVVQETQEAAQDLALEEPLEPSEPVELESLSVEPIELADVSSEVIESLPEETSEIEDVFSEGEPEPEDVGPFFVEKPKAMSVEEGQDVEFVCKVMASPTPQITWYQGNRVLKSGGRLKVTTASSGHVHTTSLKIKKVATKDSGKLLLVASNDYGEARAMISLQLVTVKKEEKVDFRKQLKTVKEETTEVELDEKAEPASFVKVPKNFDTLEGETAEFDCKVVGEPRPSLKWSRDDQDLEGERYVVDYNPSGVCVLSIQDTVTSDSGWYTCTVSNDHGQQSMRAKLTVELQPEEPQIVQLESHLPVQEDVGTLEALLESDILAEIPVEQIVPEPEPLVPAELVEPELVLVEPIKETDVDSEPLESIPEEPVHLEEVTSEGEPEPEDVAPFFVEKPKAMSVEEGQDVEFVCKVMASPAPQITWYQGNRVLKTSGRLKITTETSEMLYTTSLMIKKVASKDSGNFLVSLSNAYGEAKAMMTLQLETREKEEKPKFLKQLKTVKQEKVEVVETVVEKKEPAAFIKVPKNWTGIEGENAIFYCKVKGEPRPTLTWSIGDKTLEGDRYVVDYNPSGVCLLYVQDVVLSDSGWYSCTASNDSGEQTMRAKLIVEPKAVESVETPEEQQEEQIEVQESKSSHLTVEKRMDLRFGPIMLDFVTYETNYKIHINRIERSITLYVEQLETRERKMDIALSSQMVFSILKELELQETLASVVSQITEQVLFVDGGLPEVVISVEPQKPQGVLVFATFEGVVPEETATFFGTQQTLEIKQSFVTEEIVDEQQRAVVVEEVDSGSRVGIEARPEVAESVEPIPQEPEVVEPPVLVEPEMITVEPMKVPEVTVEPMEPLPLEPVTFEEVTSDPEPEPEPVNPSIIERPKSLTISEGEDVTFPFKIFASPTPEVLYTPVFLL
ncbi:muscle M-line assembly protein unc-89-like [Branchiostoma lanceolatum]|uniref:muscle M-line assembly protein unc-89-like n=1 Tax=Branchiostoma lanceolatum TaxID=7740 RepID=UPI003453C70B